MCKLAAVVIVTAAIVVVIVAAAAVIAENQQEKDYEPKNSVITIEDTSAVIAATITKQIHKNSLLNFNFITYYVKIFFLLQLLNSYFCCIIYKKVVMS